MIPLTDYLVSDSGFNSTSIYLHSPTELDYICSVGQNYVALVRAAPVDEAHSIWHCRAWRLYSADSDFARLALTLKAETDAPRIAQIIAPVFTKYSDIRPEQRIGDILYSIRALARETAGEPHRTADYTLLEGMR